MPKKIPLISKVIAFFFLFFSPLIYKRKKKTIIFFDPIRAKLISDVIHVSFKDHERAFFDSADWALGKVILLLTN